MKKARLKDNGFTLVEIMVSMVISSLVMAGIYGVYTIQQRSYTVQEQVSEMQQRIRSALDFMTRNIRMAGYDPTGVCDSDFIIADSDTLVFDVCERRAGVPEYRITLDYDASEGKLNVTRDAGKTGTGTSMPLAEGVDAFRFSYLEYLDSGPKEIKDTSSKENREKIEVVQVSMLVRSTYPDPRHTDTITYVPASGNASDWKTATSFSSNPANDNFHRRLLTTSIALRNM